jgi:hypothetical protein
LWDVKTATDPLARYIDPTPQPTTIAELVSLPHPRREAGARINGVETTTWVLTNVSLLGTKLESDQDYHVVAGDGRYTMIIEIPNPACVGGDSVVADGIASARREFETHFAGGSGWSARGETISVAGVGFFDRPHNQTGAAFNQIELHPVTAICFGQDCKLDVLTGAALQAHSEEQSRERQRKAALEVDVNALCRSSDMARRTVTQYQQLLATCRRPQALRSPDCTPEAGRAADAQVQSVVTKANDDENAFLQKWRSEAFVGIACQ